MSAVMSHQIGSAGFVQLTRLFAGLKRSGRVIDVIWFQQNAEYARAVLALAGENDDEAVRQIAATLQKMMRDFLAPPVTANTVIPVATTEPVPARAAEPADPADRYVGRLR